MRRNSLSTSGTNWFRHSRSPALQRRSNSVTGSDLAGSTTFFSGRCVFPRIIALIEGVASGFATNRNSRRQRGMGGRLLMWVLASDLDRLSEANRPWIETYCNVVHSSANFARPQVGHPTSEQENIMFRTKVTRTLALAGFAPGKPAIANCQERFCRSAKSMEALSLVAAVYALAAMRITPAQAATEIVLHNFASPPKGADPYPGVIRDAAGNFYGTAPGGRYGFGVVYKLDAAGQETVLHTFTGGADGGNPFVGVTRDSAGNLYGTTSNGGPANAGVVYKLDTAGNETVLYSFTGGADGGYPQAGIILDTAGNLYGTASRGGTAGAGVVYKLDTSGNETVLHAFAATDGLNPQAGV